MERLPPLRNEKDPLGEEIVGHFFCSKLAAQEAYIASLPYRLTSDQLVCVESLLKDMMILPRCCSVRDLRVTVKQHETRLARGIEIDVLRVEGHLQMSEGKYSVVAGSLDGSYLICPFSYEVGRYVGHGEVAFNDLLSLGLVQYPKVENIEGVSEEDTDDFIIQLNDIRKTLNYCNEVIKRKNSDREFNFGDIRLFKWVFDCLSKVDVRGEEKV